VERGYPHEITRSLKRDEESSIFDYLFIARPHLDVVTAVKKITGTALELTPVEKRLAFREAVEHYRSTNTDSSQPIPKVADFDRYNKQRLFLPNTGVICPSKSAFVRTLDPFKFVSAFIFYAQYFDIPTEISIDELRSVLPMKFSLVRDVYENVKRYREFVMKAQGIGLPTLEINAPDARVEFDEIAMRTSSLFRHIDSHDSSLQDVLVEFEMRHGQIDVEVPPDQMPPPPQITLGINHRRHRPKSRQTLFTFMKIWQHVNPHGCDIDAKVLVDPPTSSSIREIREIQRKLIEKYGMLPPDVCEAIGVPLFAIPTTVEINSYEGLCGGHGYGALLRDAENIVWPETEANLDDVFNNDNGIVFHNNIQFSNLVMNFTRQGEPNVHSVPRAVLRACESFVRQPKRISNLEDMVVNDWFTFVKKTFKTTGRVPTNEELEPKFLRHVERTYGSHATDDSPDNQSRLFRGVNRDGDQMTFLQGLRSRLAQEPDRSLSTPVTYDFVPSGLSPWD
jgi:hypothetical protein